MRRILRLIMIAVLVAGCAHFGGYPDLKPALSDLPEANQQALVVYPAGKFQARVMLWERTDGEWRPVKGPWPAVAGRNGIAPPDAKREGDGRAPSGIFALKRSFGYADSVDTGLEYRTVTANDYWVDDPASDQYNRWVTGRPAARSYETLRRDDDLYKYTIVVEYNTGPVVRGAGSAIFLHVWRDKDTPTAGCVALAESHVKEIMSRLDASRSPVILIQYEAR